MRDLLPHGQRHGDPPQTGISGAKFRLSLAAKRYPVQIALICALIPCSILGALVVVQGKRIERQQADIQLNRKALTVESCVANNRQTDGLNRLNDTVQALVNQGPQSLERFKPLLESSGINVDKEIAHARRQAKENSAKLQAVKVKRQDCKAQAAKIENLSPPK